MEFYQPAIDSPESNPADLKDIESKELLSKFKLRSINERLYKLEAAVQGDNIQSVPKEELKVDTTPEGLTKRILLVEQRLEATSLQQTKLD